MGKPEGGLTKWFKEDWRDVKTGKKCGRSGKEKKSRPYPACRPAKVASRISKQEAKKKTGPKAVKWSVTASGKKRASAATGGKIQAYYHGGKVHRGRKAQMT